MKTRILLSVATVAAATFGLSAAASACDMHGGFFSPMSGAQWKAYNPQVSYMDPALETDVPPARAERAKPNFSFAAKRASNKALAARAMEAEKVDAKDKAPVKKADLKKDL